MCAAYEVLLFIEIKQTIFNLIRSNKHEIHTETVNKITKSPDDDNRIICGDKIST